jgi:hypothetical protein
VAPTTATFMFCSFCFVFLVEHPFSGRALK